MMAGRPLLFENAEGLGLRSCDRWRDHEIDLPAWKRIAISSAVVYRSPRT
jgi:hypothetical protein